MYGNKRSNRINDVHTDIFMQKYKPKRDNDKISCVKTLDGSMLPPCSQVLWEKSRRTYYTAQLWMSSILPFPTELDPTDYGWQLEDNCYRIQWYNGESSPRTLEIVCEDNQENRYHDPSESAKKGEKEIEYSEEDGEESVEEDIVNESSDNWEDSECDSDQI